MTTPPFWLILVIGLLLGALPTQLNAQCNFPAGPALPTISMNQNGITREVTFSVQIQDGIHRPNRLDAGFQIFFDFGDGHYDMQQIIWPIGAIPPIIDFVHTYTEIQTYDVRAEVTKIYSDDPDPLLITCMPFNVSVKDPFYVAPSPDFHGKMLNVDFVRTPRPGYSTTCRVSYRDSCALAPGINALLHISYGSGLSVGPLIDAVRTYENEAVINHILPTNNTPGRLTILPDPFFDGYPQTFFIEFQTQPALLSGNPIFFRVDYVTNTDCEADSIMVEGLRTGHAYDPNMKSVNIDTVSNNQRHTLQYTIQFQNTGTGPTSNITIRDTLDHRLDLSTFQPRNLQLGQQVLSGGAYSIALDPVYNSIQWTINPALLRGTQEVGYGILFNDLETRGSLNFEVATHCDWEYGEQIENAASIYFDSNPPIRTDTANTIKICCQESAVPDVTTYINLSNYLPSGTNWDPSTFDILELASYADTSSLPPDTVLDFPYLEYTPQVFGGFKGMDRLCFSIEEKGGGSVDTTCIYICTAVDPALYPCDPNTCFDVFVQGGTGGTKFTTDGQVVNLFPNPFTNQMTVDASALTTRPQKLTVYNGQGIPKHHQEFGDKTTMKFATHSWEKGIYVVVIDNLWYGYALKN